MSVYYSGWGKLKMFSFWNLDYKIDFTGPKAWKISIDSQKKFQCIFER